MICPRSLAILTRPPITKRSSLIEDSTPDSPPKFCHTRPSSFSCPYSYFVKLDKYLVRDSTVLLVGTMDISWRLIFAVVPQMERHVGTSEDRTTHLPSGDGVLQRQGFPWMPLPLTFV